jgi:uncharacterized protein (DUF2164 family)
MTTIEISKQARTDAIASLQRYFEENMTEPLGNLPAGLLLDFFLEEVGPAVYNQAMQQQATDLDGVLYADAFQYWVEIDAKRKRRH